MPGQFRLGATEDITMPRQITIELPDVFTIDSARDAPEEYRSVNTANWDADFVLDALQFGISERSGNTWSVGKKSVEKMAAGHKALEEGIWNGKRKGTGASALKFDAAIAKLNADQLIAKLPAELLSALAAKIAADNAK
jgi:hypothetical protein